jgi:transposase
MDKINTGSYNHTNNFLQSHWIDRWWSGGVGGLANRPKSGRPLKADDADSLKFLEVIEKEPSELGYDFTIWTIDRLRAHLEKETGIGLSESRFRAMLKRKGYRYRRPKLRICQISQTTSPTYAR